MQAARERKSVPERKPGRQGHVKKSFEKRWQPCQQGLPRKEHGSASTWDRKSLEGLSDPSGSSPGASRGE